MCGINGIVSFSNHDKKDIIDLMNNSLSHRGPDNSGSYNCDYVSLGHTRLSIIDLSENANQPLYSKDKRYVLIFNGEIYNFKTLKNKLDYNFVTESDSEVVLAAFLKWKQNCLKHLNGMFAFAIWDSLKSELFLARDRFGIKPLYYYHSNEFFIFSSELRSIINSGLVKPLISENGLVDYLKFQTVFSPNTLIKDIYSLEASTYAWLNSNNLLKTSKYWELSLNKYDLSKLSYEEIKNKIFYNLKESVRKRMFADVNSGVFLSGGLDSSIIVSIMRSLTDKKINTFNISFDESEFSESKYARIIADKFKTDHKEIILSPKIFLENISEALDDMDHPSGDGVNSWIVSKYTKEKGVKMVFSGMGGDELFMGYPFYNKINYIFNFYKFFKIPQFIRRFIFKLLNPILNSVNQKKFLQLLKLKSPNFSEIYKISRQNFLDEEILKLLKKKNKDLVSFEKNEKLNFLPNKIYSLITNFEFKNYLQNILLRDTDQMSMAHSLEVRVPYLDHEFVELIVSVDDKYKDPKLSKKLLYDSFENLIPNEIFKRKKMGFTFPWDSWIKNELFDFSEKLIKDLSERNLFNNQEILNLWNRFIKGDKTVKFTKIWSLIVLEYWLQKNNISD